MTTTLILAAGASSRMGRPKQTLPIGEDILLVHTTKQAITAALGPVFVVLGSNGAEHQTRLHAFDISVYHHPDWSAGMGSSLKAGVHEVLRLYPTTTQLLVMVCDQPRITAIHLQQLHAAASHNQAGIIASRYNNTLGVPVIFKAPYFDALLQIPDQAGAKIILQQHPNDVLALDIPEGATDLDTPDDYIQYLNQPS